MPTTSTLPRTRPDDVPERLLILPAAQDVADTPYAHARRLAEQAVATSAAPPWPRATPPPRPC
ncbi:hypothetical protein ACUXPL_001912 [Micrococcus sp. 140720015-1]